jgi:hypothetical protein
VTDRVKIRIDSDEWYPVHSINDEYGEWVDVPATTVKRWRRIEKEFAQMQTEMDEALGKAAPA